MENEALSKASAEMEEKSLRARLLFWIEYRGGFTLAEAVWFARARG